MMEVFGAYPVEIWGLNYQGYGKSKGKANLQSIPKDAHKAYDEILKASEGRPIIISGNSIGTTAALYIASHNQVAGVFLKNPPPLQNLIIENHGSWNLWLLATP
ncbi:MAG: alpha/beta hydrolase [Candidatus Caenarcaniphilales bacterium]|nr:alpha/beta hydrolase [Candidatus Caenarcaniphilales bacterium]